MRKTILAWVLVALSFSSCFTESDELCATWKFYIDDMYAPGDFDSKIGNDVLFTVFTHGKVVSSFVIPRGDIVNGEYITRNIDNTDGSTIVTAWGVPPGDPTACYTPLAVGTDLQSLYFDMGTTIGTGNELPLSQQMYFGSYKVEDNSKYREIKMHVGYCRVEVRVHYAGQGGVFSSPGSDPKVQVNGIASDVDLMGEGFGAPDSEVGKLTPRAGEPSVYSTMLLVMPSGLGQHLTIDIMDGSTKLATLSGVNGEPVEADVGEYILFNYYPSNNSVTLTVDGWEEKGEVVVL